MSAGGSMQSCLPPPLSVLLLLLLSLLSSGPTARGVHAAAFLQDELPLTLVVASPVALLSNGTAAVPLEGSQAIQAVFSRPVIALGSDFGNEDNTGGKAPFSLSCDTPGRFRWVTTTIARFDVAAPGWPSDLDCTLNWNTSLTSYDGAPLLLSSPGSVPLSTAGLQLSLTSVSSKKADNLTDSLWDANIGMPDDLLPEVPPDGTIQLSFNWAVNLGLLQQALRLAPADTAADGDATVSVVVVPCEMALQPLMFDALSSAGASSEDLSVLNDSCASVAAVGGGLRPQTGYALTLPAGSNYSALSGPLATLQSASLAGLRSFRLPLRGDFGTRDSPQDPPVSYGTSSRRLDLWLPHGLDAGTGVDQVAAQVTLCAYDQPYVKGATCSPLSFNASLVSKGLLRLSVPDLQPSTRHHAAVAPSAAVRDGYGQPLLATANDFWSTDLSSLFSAPSTSGNVALFEPQTAPPSWPFIARGVTDGAASVGSWAIDLTDDAALAAVVQLSAGYTWGVYVPSLLGKPGITETVANKTAAYQLGVSLGSTENGAAPGSLTVVHTCCSVVTYPTTHTASSSVAVVSQTRLSATFVATGANLTAWVTTAAAEAPGPVANATVRIYLVPYSSDQGGGRQSGRRKRSRGGRGRSGPRIRRANARVLGSCRTAADGTCSLPLPDTTSLNGLLAGLVLSGGEALLLPAVDAGGGVLAAQEYQGAIVLDRLVVQQGDSLHITGYVQSQSGGKLHLPTDLSAVSVSVSPSLNASDAANGQAGAPISTALDPTSGSFHLVLPIPADTTSGQYSLLASVNGGASAGSGRRLRQKVMGRGSASSSSSSMAVSGGPARGQQSSPGDYSSVSVATQAFTVADPRPPTAQLTLTLPPWVQPGAKVAVDVLAVSYIGANVGNATMAVSWTLPEATGNASITTDANGAGSTVIDLGLLHGVNASAVGDSLQVTVQWVGPTRELLEQTGTVAIQDAAYTVSVGQTLDTVLPGDVFGVLATVSATTTGGSVPVGGAAVRVSLAPDAATGGAECAAAEQTCFTTSGLSNPADCQLALPCRGHFRLTACVDVAANATAGGNATACGFFVFGLNSTEWAALPWAAQNAPSLDTDKASYVQGDTAVLRFQNSWTNATTLILWGNTEATQHTLHTKVPRGAVELPLPVGTECVGDCSVLVLLSVPRVAAQPGVWPPAPAVPTSRLFDPLAPHSHVMRTTLTVTEDRTLDVSITISSGNSTAAAPAPSAPAAANGTAEFVAAPGDDTTVSVDVTFQGQPAAGAEVTLLAVDKSILSLLPYPLPNLTNAIVLELAAQLSVSVVDGFRVAPGAVEAAFAAVVRRLGIDPYLPADTTVQASPYGLASVDMTDDQYLAQYSDVLTYLPYRGQVFSPLMTARGGAAAMPKVGAGIAPEAAAGSAAISSTQLADSNSASYGSTATAAPAVPPVRQQGDFQVTPLFVVLIAKADGSAVARFKAPVNLGTYTLRAFAVAGAEARYGSAEVDMIVRRTVSLTPSVPRFVRVGDTFQAGVIVTVSGVPADDVPPPVTVVMKLGSSSALQATSSSSTQTVKFGAGETQQEVRFGFQAVSVGDANVTFQATDSAGAGDAVELDLAVMGQQSAVDVATSFAIRANSSSVVQWQEGLQLPDAVAGSGSLDLLAGVGHLAAIQALVRGVANQRGTYPDAYTAVALATLPPLLALYAQPVPKDLTDAVTQAYKDLKTLTDPTWGLLYVSPTQYGGGYQTTSTDVALNAWAVWLVGGLGGFTLPDTSPFKAQWDATGKLASGWLASAEAQLVTDANEARSGRFSPAAPYGDLYTLAWLRLAAGPQWAPTNCAKDDTSSSSSSSSSSSANGATSVTASSMGSSTASSSGSVGRTGRRLADILAAAGLASTSATSSLAVQPSVAVLGFEVAAVPERPPRRLSASSVCAASPLVVQDLSLQRLADTTAGLSLSSEVISALALQAAATSTAKLGSAVPRNASAVVAQVVNDVLSNIRVSGQVAYVAADFGAAYPAGLDSQSLALLLLLRAKKDNPLVSKLTAYVAQQQPTGGGGGIASPFGPVPPLSPSPYAVAIATTALGSYDVTSGSVQPSLKLVAAVGDQVLLQASFTPSSDVLASSSTPWEALPTPPGALTFNVSGQGEVGIAASLRFVPAELLAFPTYRGIFVERIIQSDGGEGPVLVAVPLGSIVTITLQVTTPDQLGAVVLQALMPGGLEPVDPNLAAGGGSGGATCALGQQLDSDLTSWFSSRWWWPICPAQTTLPSVVTFQYAALMAGTSSVSFQAVAATSGTFVLPPVQAWAVQQPEVMGMTAGGTFRVCPSSSACSGAAAPAAAAALACPGNCSGAGVCNLQKGQCICDAGFSGADCATPLSAK